MGFTYKYLKEGVKDSLFPNQRNNANGLFLRERALLCDKVGSGKTLSVLSAFCILNEVSSRKMLVFTPKSAYDKKVWEKDIKKFTKLRAVSLDELFANEGAVISDCFSYMENYDVVYAKHTSVKDDKMQHIMNALMKLHPIVVIDEVHALRNPDSALSKNFYMNVICKSPARVWGITGTPLSKNLEDTFHILDFIKPGMLGSFWEFRARYCKLVDRVVGYDRVRKQPKTVKVIVGLLDYESFKAAISPVVIVGESFASLNFHYVDYTLSRDESALYEKLAHGISLNPDDDDETWLSNVLSSETKSDSSVSRIKSVDKYSSRFLYLQSAADGTLNQDGTIFSERSSKIDALIGLLKEIIQEGQSVLVYFDYYASLESVKSRINKEGLKCKLLESSGKHTLTDDDLSEEKVARIPHVVLCTKASAESASYYFINNTVFFQIPTVPHTFVQFNGRITRKNTLFPDDLHCYIFRSSNIDLYKLMMVSGKAKQMETTSGAEHNIPEDYKGTDAVAIDKMKNLLLWCR